MEQATPVRVGDIAVGDFSAAWRYFGRDRLPYPITAVVPGDVDDADIGERLRTGDLAAFRPWLNAFQSADIWVVARTHPSDATQAERQILVYRAGDIGYVAVKCGEDPIEVSTVSALTLGDAIAQQSGHSHPGTEPLITVPGYAGFFVESDAAESDYVDEDDDFSVTVTDRPAASGPDHEEIADSSVTSVTTVQSSWRPARRWGIDWSRRTVVWVNVADDGDYVYTDDYAYATPMTKQLLAERINRLIASDIVELRANRGRA